MHPFRWVMRKCSRRNSVGPSVLRCRPRSRGWVAGSRRKPPSSTASSVDLRAWRRSTALMRAISLRGLKGLRRSHRHPARGLDLVALLGAGREHDDGRGGCAAPARNWRAKSIPLMPGSIQSSSTRSGSAWAPAPCRFGVGGSRDRPAAQVDPDQRLDRGFVFDHQDALRAWGFETAGISGKCIAGLMTVP